MSEISAEEKYKQFLCHLLYILSKGVIRVSQRDLNSTIASSPLSQQIIDIMGTEEYIAPETLEDTDVSYASDLWSLGVIMFQMLEGKTPFIGRTSFETY